MTVEVAFLLVLLVVPLFYLVGTLGRLQAGAYAVSVPTTLPSASSGAITAERMGQSGSEHVTTSDPITEVVPDVRVPEACSCASGPWCSPGPVQPSRPPASQMATALAPRIERR